MTWNDAPTSLVGPTVQIIEKNSSYFKTILLIFYTYPTSLFPILEPRNPWIDGFNVVQERRATDFKAPKLWKGSSGI